MCMSCGCMQPDDNHGDERNLTRDDLDRAAQVAGISRDQAAQNIMACCQQAGAVPDQGAQTSGPAQQGQQA